MNGEHVRATDEVVNAPILGLGCEELDDAHFVMFHNLHKYYIPFTHLLHTS